MHKTKTILLGLGGHARVILDILKLNRIRVTGFCLSSKDAIPSETLGLKNLGDEDSLKDEDPNDIVLINAVGSLMPAPNPRSKVFERCKKMGFRFATLIHPSAIIADDVILEEGAQIMAGSIIQPCSRIGANTIVNTSASIDHDCKVGAHCHIAPGVVLSGGVQIGRGCHIGTSASVIQGISIGTGALVAAGAVVVKSVKAKASIGGVPARPLSR